MRRLRKATPILPSVARALALFLIRSGLAVVPVAAQTVVPGKPGGTLRMVLREDLPQGPYVKNLILNQVTYNCCRLQEVWLDK